MAFARLLALLSLVLGTPTLAADPHPPQLAVSFLAKPAPIVQDGATRLVYEMQIVNYTQSLYVLDAVEAKAGEIAAAFRGPALDGMIAVSAFRATRSAPPIARSSPGAARLFSSCSTSAKA